MLHSSGSSLKATRTCRSWGLFHSSCSAPVSAILRFWRFLELPHHFPITENHTKSTTSSDNQQIPFWLKLIASKERSHIWPENRKIIDSKVALSYWICNFQNKVTLKKNQLNNETTWYPPGNYHIPYQGPVSRWFFFSQGGIHDIIPCKGSSWLVFHLDPKFSRWEVAAV